MQKPWIPVFLFALLFIWVISSVEYASSVVPGWHTTIFPPYFFISLSLLVILLVVIVGYWILAKRGTFHLSFFIIHMTLTLPAVLFSRLPSLLTLMDGPDILVNEQPILFSTVAVFASFVLFMLGQVLFAIYFFRTITLQHSRTGNS